MPSEIRIYFEGNKSLKAGFDAFFREIRARASAVQCRVTIDRHRRDSRAGFRHRDEKASGGLERPTPRQRRPLEPGPADFTVRETALAASQVNSIFWMVEMMESWFHADKDALEEYYKDNFRREALKANPNVEEISKHDLIEGLKAATKDTTKGKYHKTKHAPALLQSIKPALVRKAAPQLRKALYVGT